VRRYLRVQAAINFARQHRIQWESSPENPIVPAPMNSNGSLMLEEMARFDQSVNFAIQSRTLQYFDLGQNLAPVHRAVGTVSGFLRPAAGWCLLLGLIITLFNLQRAVGDLSGAFHAISPQNSISMAEGLASAKAREQNVTDRMAGMANSASRAFVISLTFISIALYCGIFSAFVERSGRKAASEFEQWAVIFYQNSLPGQLPVTEGKVAQLLADSMAGMGEVIDELRAASGAFANLQPLVSSMSRATDSIEAAMRQLPEDLRSSMTNVTSGMVSQLTETLGESAEYTKKILAIYAEQELRVKGLHSVVNSSQSALAEIKEAHKLLEGLPVQTARLSDSAPCHQTR
jgi:hypothetical protein